MAISLRASRKIKVKRSSYRKGHQKAQGSNEQWQEFVFDGDDATDDEIAFSTPPNSYQLRKRDTVYDSQDFTLPKPHIQNRKKLIDYEVQSSDTLQSISLRYGCSVAELKLVNKLIKDQDFYAHRTVQIPVSEHGVLIESFAETKNGPAPSEESNVVNLSIGQMLADDSSVASQSFLQAMDKDIQRIVETTVNHVNAESEVLNLPRFHTMATAKTQRCDGSNWGLNWWCLLMGLLIVGVLTPILYGLYEAS